MASLVVRTVILLFVTSQVCCQSSVTDDTSICDSTDPSLFCDPHNVLAEEDTVELRATIKEVNNGSVCVCSNCTYQQAGYTIAVAIIVQLNCKESGLSFAEDLRHEWLFNKTMCDDSILVLYSNNDDQHFIVMGEPLGKRISNSTINGLYNDCDSMDSVVECLESAVKKLDEAITKAIEKETVKDDNLIWGILGFVAIVSILGFHYYVKY